MKYLIFAILLVFSTSIYSQSIENSKTRINELSSEKYFGRSYLKNGVNKAGKYLAKEFKKIGLKSFDNNSYFQNYNIELQNIFPGKQYLAIDGKELILGKDYIIDINSGSYKTKSKIIYYSDTAIFKKQCNEIKNKEIYKDYILIVDTLISKNDNEYIDSIPNINCVYKLFKDKFILMPEEKDFLVKVTNPNRIKNIKNYKPEGIKLDIKKENFPKNGKEIEINIKSKLLKNLNASNIIGYVEGEIKDSFYVFVAHYDHVGGQGKSFYVEGAQDNASGVAFVLDLADYYSKHKAKYSIAFILFSGEETGLLGSSYYVENPLFDLKKIKLLINFDMVGTGDDGFTIVNGGEKEYQKISNTFLKIASEKQLFDTTKINLRGRACNSDHCPFNLKNVPGIFIYTMGGKTYYHNPKDKIETMTFSAYTAIFNIIIELLKK